MLSRQAVFWWVILPLALVATSLITEASLVYQRIKSGEWNVGVYARQIFDALPGWFVQLLDRFGMGNFQALQERLTSVETMWPFLSSTGTCSV